eukprot:CAMPEP_0177259620 /NCGR_PEP_ID=MMETSP0367-20130122/58749_1 /TAXON_ID=447022 ORGANISM="Scrippsiella hangoei-like, Strain SHHI-4" /NCGR_SAMPLE_ID=MMETSP0367 /ASSEMBLY_ACC=CAM_ASM_000362 /LENGTH=120 /DNA_ID=CAMNT_0018713937 /DNA_START=254 /DNA_END=613 /DNA_ORIENTATION=+
MTSALDTLFLGPTRRGGGVGGSASNSSRALADSVGASWSRPSIPLSGASRRLHFNSESMPCPVIGSSTTFAPLWASNRPTSSNAAVAWNSLAISACKLCPTAWARADSVTLGSAPEAASS